MTTGRERVLRATERAVMADRHDLYAPPELNFKRIADLWTLYLEGRSEITPYDTAIMMVLVKVARLQTSPHVEDHLVDIAGYAACAADVMPNEPQESADAVDAGRPGTYEGRAGTLHVSEDNPDMWTFLFEAGGKMVLHSSTALAAMEQGVLRVDEEGS